MKIKDYMSKNVRTVDLDATLEDISKIFEKRGFHHVLVLDDGELMGVISDRDVLKATSPFLNRPIERDKDRVTLKIRAHSFMTRHPLTMKPDDNLKDAIELMNAKRFSCLPIVEENGKVAGILTVTDIVRFAAQKVGFNADEHEE